MSAERPLVTVVIPTHNRARLLHEAVASVAGQTYSAWELLVVDDGSTDDTVALMAGWSARDSRIRCLRQRNQGPQRARNQGRDHGTGTFVAFLDDDDLWLPEKLERQVRYFEEHPELGFLYTACTVRSMEGAVLGVKPAGGVQDTFRSLVCRNHVPLSSVVVRRRCLDEAGWFDGRFRHGEDYELWLRLSCRFRFSGLREELTVWRAHDNNSTRQPMRAVVDRWWVRTYETLRQDAALSTTDRRWVARSLGCAWYWAGREYVRRRRWREACYAFLAGLRSDAWTGWWLGRERVWWPARLLGLVKPLVAVAVTWLLGMCARRPAAISGLRRTAWFGCLRVPIRIFSTHAINRTLGK